MFWVMREQLREKKLAIPAGGPQRAIGPRSPEEPSIEGDRGSYSALALAPTLWSQLTSIEWDMQSDRAIRVWKRGIGKHGGVSPDLADALALAVEAKNRHNRGLGVVFSSV